jgi:hypothetical protein
MPYRRTLLRAACAGVALAAAARSAPAQITWHAVLAAGPADAGARRGAVGHLGLRAAPGGREAWVQLRADATAGRSGGQAVRAATAALELGPPATRTGGVRVFGLAGGSAVRTGGRSDGGLAAGLGARVPVGRAWISAEQRFQPGFSPLLVGLSF